MTIFSLEFLTFGLNRLLDAAEKNDEELCLLTSDPSRYAYEIEQINNKNFSIIQIDTSDVGQLYKMIEGNAADVHGMISTTDTWGLIAAELAKRLGCSAQSLSMIKILRNKYQVRQCLYEHNLSSCKSWLVDPFIGINHAVLNEINYPVVIKDNAGTSSQNVWIAYHKKDLEEIIAFTKTVHLRGKILTIESYISGTLYSAEVLVWGKEIKLFCLTSRILSSEPYFMEEVCSLPIQFPTAQTIALKSWLSDILGVLRYTKGFAHIEFMVTHDGFEIIEINPRLGGVRIGDAICEIYDLNIYEAFIEMALGKKPHLLDATLTAKKGVAMALIYADKKGNFKGVKSLNKLSLHPGDPIYYPIAYEGQYIEYLNDQRACVGIVSAIGDNSEIAMQNVLAAKNKLMVEINQ